jgi:nicotinamidase-related amidase
MEGPHCLIVVDLQERYREQATSELCTAVRKAIGTFRKYGRVIFVLHDINATTRMKRNPKLQDLEAMHGTGYGVHHCIPLKCAWPEVGETVIMKNTFDAFLGTDLEKVVADYPVLHVCGLLTGMCVLSTVFSGNRIGHEMVVIEDACIDGQRHADVIRHCIPHIASIVQSRNLQPGTPPGNLQDLNNHAMLSTSYRVPLARSGKIVVIMYSLHMLTSCQRAPIARQISNLLKRGIKVMYNVVDMRCPEIRDYGTVVIAGGVASVDLMRTILDAYNNGKTVKLAVNCIFDIDSVSRQLPERSYGGQLCQVIDDLYSV